MSNKNSKVQYTHPAVWSDSYDEQAQMQVINIINYLNDKQLTKAWLAMASATKVATLSQLINGKYPSPPHQMLDTLWSSCQNHSDRNKINSVPFVEATLYKLVVAACKFARTLRCFSVITGRSGVGKTRSVEEYAAKNDNVILIKPNPLMSQGALLDQLVKITHATVVSGSQYKKGSREERYISVEKELKGTDYLLILDEANTVSNGAIETLRRLRDNAHVGVVLVGTQQLTNLIKPGLQFDQLSNRVSFWPKTIESITRKDADKVTQAGFAELEGLEDKILDRFWDYHQGNMRVLTEMLIPSIKIFGLGQGNTMSVKLIDHIASTMLSIKPIAQKRGTR